MEVRRRPLGDFNVQTNLAYWMLTFWSYSLASATLSPWSQETCSSDNADTEIRINQDLRSDTRLFITDLLRTSSRSFRSLVSRQSLSRECSLMTEVTGSNGQTSRFRERKCLTVSEYVGLHRDPCAILGRLSAHGCSCNKQFLLIRKSLYYRKISGLMTLKIMTNPLTTNHSHYYSNRSCRPSIMICFYLANLSCDGSSAQ
jgi:hypothetical protein